ncbi:MULTISPECIES: sugar porter family MFS transporter [Xanthobacter]|uniref:sugar porter family MFS transporter n=1 Tax=Xanthobacter TaxID=279 RepID=UPI001F19917D|nr:MULTISPECIES: sugar porter family MFS transporter [unclassified Xanthobacter]
MIYFIAAIAGLAGALFGFDEGVIAGALGPLRTDFGIDPLAEGVMTAAVPFGALAGALIGGRIAPASGRRRMLLGAALLFICGALGSALAWDLWSLTAARLVIGVAVGMAAMMAPLYISESAPTAQRGMLVSIYQLAVTLGILGAYVVGYLLSDSWRWMFAMGALPALVLFFGIFSQTDTPRWLMARGRQTEARRALAHLRNVPETHPDVEKELSEIRSASVADLKPGRLSDLFTPQLRPALYVSMGLFLLQQLSGINAVIYYAPTVFQISGFDSTSTQILATAGVGAVNVLMTIVGMLLIDRLGRRLLLLLGFAGTAVALGAIAISSATGSPSLGVVALGGLLLYISAFAISIGPLPWVMMAEVFPLNVRSLGMSLASLVNWGFNFLVVFSFPVLVAELGLAGVFAIYALVCIAGLAFTLRAVPETSGVSLEDIERHLKSGRPFRELGTAPLASRAL